MTSWLITGTALRLLCLCVLSTGLGSCNQAPPKKLSDAQARKFPDAEALGREFKANIEATKKSPALAPGGKFAGAPIHVDPQVRQAPKGSAHDAHHAHTPGDPKGC